ncbi:uncharacterized protein LOC127856981 isoform X2 [Dreissena polymorpha]|uniref:uncharacterized protein LOC127856981 isoform X2 n=1 Tax=Dreissena polymorpha TaxID=45954 RepID=UPI002264C034|nr:uncharacterized protein LOC127856981 isoform X2 [Dreissena polymorpha]
MLPPISSRTTPMSGETIIKLARQHYECNHDLKSQPLQPYQHEPIQCRTNVTCQTRKPEDYWNRNFGRRQSNLHRGFYSTQTEPYKPIGGDVILDSSELFFSSFPSESIEPKARYNYRRGTLKSLDLEPKVVTKSDKKSESSSLTGSGLQECYSSAGYDDIRRLLKESRQRITMVKGGMPYEEHIKAGEDRSKNIVDMGRPPPDSGMVLQSVSSINIGTFKPSNSKTSSRKTSGHYGADKTCVNKEEGRGVSRASTPYSLLGSTRNGVMAPPSRERSSSKMSPLTVSSRIAAICQRKERQFRDHLLYLQSVNSILTALHNMKLKDIRSKVPLSKEVVERLQKEGPCLTCKDDERGSKGPYNVPRAIRQRTSVVDVDNESNTSERGTTRQSIVGASRRANPLDMGKGFGRRRSRMAGPMPVSDMRGLETWEDFLNVQSEEYKDAHGSLHFQIGIISKFMRWRASVLPSHAQTSTGPQIPDRATILEMLESQGAERDREHSKDEVKPSLAALHGPSHPTEKKKLPIWQQVAQEKSVFTNIQNKDKTLNPDTTILRFKKNMNKLRKNLEKENTAEIEKMVRERVANFRLKFSTLNSEERSCIFEEQMLRIQEVKDNVNKTHLENFDVQPSKWYEELLHQTVALISSFDQPQLQEALTKLQTYAHMDNKTVPFAKSKLCLLMMSLPAYDICQIHMQRALKMVFEEILLGQEVQFDEWLALRKIPYMVTGSDQPLEPSSGLAHPSKEP